MQKVLIAPTAFKGTLSPISVANAIARGLEISAKAADLIPVLLPLADGGDGTIESVHMATGGRVHTVRITSDNGTAHQARWLELGDEALVELASACGIALLHGRLEPLNASTSGLGQVIKHVIDQGFRTINIAVGGSASTDGGAGALQALGARFFDELGGEITSINGGKLALVRSCDFSALKAIQTRCRFQLLTDVENPLYGPLGAAYVFSAQKGASQAQIEVLDAALKQFSLIVEKTSMRQVHDQPGAGAAGGTAFGLASALGATITPGFDWIADICRLEEKLAGCGLTVTGEGRLDSQSVQGKVIGKLVNLCRRHGKPLWIVAGSTDADLAITEMGRILVPARKANWCTADEISEAVARAVELHNFFTVET